MGLEAVPNLNYYLVIILDGTPNQLTPIIFYFRGAKNKQEQQPDTNDH